jgi:dephospho-CoA kinase
MHPLVYGLTGGIACGKSTVATLLRERGWTIVDSDAIAHRLMAPAGENWQKMIDAFGPSILNADQTINRVVLGDMVFREPSLRDRLNSLTHPAIRKAWHAEREGFLEKITAGRLDRKRDRLAVVIPLLYETGLGDEFGAVMCVGCSPALQRARLQGRGLDGERIGQRLASQWPLEEKIRRSDILLWNEGSLETLAQQVGRLPESAAE